MRASIDATTNVGTRLEVAANWLQRLRSAPYEGSTFKSWLRWSGNPANKADFDKVLGVWLTLHAPEARPTLMRRLDALVWAPLIYPEHDIGK
jgi:ferric-dicitrate binding protein FerR (iron transport regulator)